MNTKDTATAGCRQYTTEDLMKVFPCLQMPDEWEGGADMTEQEALDKIGQLKAEKEKLEAANRELNAVLQEQAAEQSAREQYMKGLIDALVFAVRCNGVSGNDVEPPGRFRGWGND